MARTVILGAGVAGHTAALHLRRMVGKEHDVVVVAPNSKWNWIPSNIWVGVGQMTVKQVTFPLAPIYQRKGIEFHQALAIELHGEGSAELPRPHVTVRYTDPAREGEVANLEYDYLINATGPKLNFGATPGLGPDGHTWSVCTAGHAVETAKAFDDVVARLKGGEHQTLLIGMGHGTCTCQGAAFEYTFNVEHELVKEGVRDKADVIYITNECAARRLRHGRHELRPQGRRHPQPDVHRVALPRARRQGDHVGARREGRARRRALRAGRRHQGRAALRLRDAAPALPRRRHAGVRRGTATTSPAEVFAPSGFMKVDADYSPKPYEEWKASDWPKTYQSVKYDNVWAAGIAFAPPHQMSRPRTSPNGTVIAPAPPRTGMPSGVIGRAVAQTIAQRIKHGAQGKVHTASMADMGAACIASAGKGWRTGTAAAMTVFPIIPDKEKYGELGRDTKETYGEIGLSAHWMKVMLHYLFIYKAKARPFWYLIPE